MRCDLPDNALAWDASPSGTRTRRLRTEESQDAFLAAWQWPQVKVNRAMTATLPITGNVPVGTLTLSLGGSELAQLPLEVWTGP